MNTEPNITDPDAFYAAWVGAQQDLSESDSADYNARLVLLLANQIGDDTVLQACIQAARQP